MRKPESFYRAHGLSIRSELEITEFREVAAAPPDLEILLDPTARRVADDAARAAGVDPFEAWAIPVTDGAAGACFRIEHAASFWVRDGREIRVAPEPDADPRLIALFVLGSAMGLALFQRGALVLHGASVARGAHATLFLGPSGAGKSTLAARLGQAGRPILGDDTVALWPAPVPCGHVVHPAGTSFKLWRDALEAVGLDRPGLPEVAQRVEKFYLTNPRQAEERTYEIDEVMILDRAAPGDAPQVEPLDCLEAVRELSDNAYRPQFIDIFGARAEHFRQIAALAGRVRVARLRRPWSHEAGRAVVDLLSRHWDHAAPARTADALP